MSLRSLIIATLFFVLSPIASANDINEMFPDFSTLSDSHILVNCPTQTWTRPAGRYLLYAGAPTFSLSLVLRAQAWRTLETHIPARETLLEIIKLEKALVDMRAARTPESILQNTEANLKNKKMELQRQLGQNSNLAKQLDSVSLAQLEEGIEKKINGAHTRVRIFYRPIHIGLLGLGIGFALLMYQPTETKIVPSDLAQHPLALQCLNDLLNEM